MSQMNILWDFYKQIDQETLDHNVNLLHESSLVHQIFVDEERFHEKKLSGFNKIVPIKEAEFYSLLKSKNTLPLMRIRSAKFKISPQTIEKIYTQHKERNTLFTYCDAYDLQISLSYELVEPKILDTIGSKKPYFPDKTLGISQFVPNDTYLLDFSDQTFYYVKNFDRYYKYPLGMNVETVSACNLKCTMCQYHSDNYTQDWKKNADPLMSWETWTKIIDEVSQYPNPPSIEMIFRGEPLLHKKFVDMVRYASERNVYIYPITNATILTKEISDALLDAGVSAMYFSLDGGKRETYNAIRIGAEYNEVVKNIEYFLERNEQTRKVPTMIKTVHMSVNQEEQDLIVEKWLDKVDYITIQNQIIPQQPGREGFENWHSPVTEKMLHNKRYPCHLLWTLLTVTTRGAVANCANFFFDRDEDSIGHLDHQSLYEMWHSNEMNNRRQNALSRKFGKIPLCNKCDGVTCTTLGLSKEITSDNVFLHSYAVQRIYTRSDNKKLYPHFDKTPDFLELQQAALKGFRGNLSEKYTYNEGISSAALTELQR